MGTSRVKSVWLRNRNGSGGLSSSGVKNRTRLASIPPINSSAPVCGPPTMPFARVQRRYEVARQKRNVMDKSHVVGLGRAVARSDAEGGAAHPTHPATKRAVAIPSSLTQPTVTGWLCAPSALTPPARNRGCMFRTPMISTSQRCEPLPDPPFVRESRKHRQCGRSGQR